MDKEKEQEANKQRRKSKKAGGRLSSETQEHSEAAETASMLKFSSKTSIARPVSNGKPVLSASRPRSASIATPASHAPELMKPKKSADVLGEASSSKSASMEVPSIVEEEDDGWEVQSNRRRSSMNVSMAVSTHFVQKMAACEC